MPKIMIVVGHPQRTTFCEAIGKTYARGPPPPDTTLSYSSFPR